MNYLSSFSVYFRVYIHTSTSAYIFTKYFKIFWWCYPAFGSFLAAACAVTIPHVN